MSSIIIKASFKDMWWLVIPRKLFWIFTRGEKKTEKPNKPKKKKPKKLNRKKKPIKPIKFFAKIFGSVRFQKPETEKTPTKPNRFGLRGTINTKKNRVTFLNPSIHTPAPAVFLLAPEPLPQLTIHNFTSVTKSIHLHLLDHNQPHPSPNIFIFKRQPTTSLSRRPPSSSSNPSQPRPSLTRSHPILNRRTHTTPAHRTSRVQLQIQSGSHLPISHPTLNRVTPGMVSFFCQSLFFFFFEHMLCDSIYFLINFLRRNLWQRQCVFLCWER